MRCLPELTNRWLLAALLRDCVVMQGVKYSVEDKHSGVCVRLNDGGEDDGLVVYRADEATLRREWYP